MEEFRIDSAYGNVYKWDAAAEAYVYFCKEATFEAEETTDRTTMEQERQARIRTHEETYPAPSGGPIREAQKIEIATIPFANGEIPKASRAAVNAMDDGGASWKSGPPPTDADIVRSRVIYNVADMASVGDRLIYWREVQ